jgi:hypothetical protein
MTLLLKSVPAHRGPRWIVLAFRLFGGKPLLFTMMFAVFLFAALVVSLVPLLGGLVQMMSLPLLSLGFMIASRSAQNGGPVHPAQFIEPLRGDAQRRRAMLTLCVIYGVGALLILWLADAISDSAWARLQALMVQGEKAQAEVDALLAEPGVATAVMLALVLGTALSVPFWHAPALVHWAGQGVAQSLFSSTLAVWRCKGAFFAYAVAWLGLILGFGLLAALLFALLGTPQLANVVAVPAGLTFSTVFYISLLFTFDDSFGTSPDEGAAGIGTLPDSR